MVVQREVLGWNPNSQPQNIWYYAYSLNSYIINLFMHSKNPLQSSNHGFAMHDAKRGLVVESCVPFEKYGEGGVTIITYISDLMFERRWLRESYTRGLDNFLSYTSGGSRWPSSYKVPSIPYL